MKHSRIRRFTDNLLLKLIALVIAMLIWFFITNNDDPIRTQLFTNVEIHMMNENSIADVGKVVEPEGTGTVTLKVRERRSVLESLSKGGENFRVEADLNNINSMNSVPLTVTCDKSNVTWDEIEISPASLKVSLENKIEEPFAVSVSTSGTPASGLAVGGTTVIQGKNILIAGPESIINIISQVTAPISVSGLAKDSSLTSQLKVIDRNDEELTEAQLSRLEFKDSTGALLENGTVNVKVELWKKKTEVPILVGTSGEPAEGYRVSGVNLIPSSIGLAGTDEAFEKLGGTLVADERISVEGATGNISAEINLSDTLAQYTGLKLLTEEEPIISVEIQIERVDDRSYAIPLSEIDMKDLPSDMKLVFTPADSITVSVHADSAALSDLHPSDIEAKMDLSECKSAGTYVIPVEITLPEGYSLNESVEVTVMSTVPEQEMVTEAD